MHPEKYPGKKTYAQYFARDFPDAFFAPFFSLYNCRILVQPSYHIKRTTVVYEHNILKSLDEIFLCPTRRKTIH